MTKIHTVNNPDAIAESFLRGDYGVAHPNRRKKRMVGELPLLLDSPNFVPLVDASQHTFDKGELDQGNVGADRIGKETPSIELLQRGLIDADSRPDLVLMSREEHESKEFIETIGILGNVIVTTLDTRLDPNLGHAVSARVNRIIRDASNASTSDMPERETMYRTARRDRRAGNPGGLYARIKAGVAIKEGLAYANLVNGAKIKSGGDIRKLVPETEHHRPKKGHHLENIARHNPYYRRQANTISQFSAFSEYVMPVSEEVALFDYAISLGLNAKGVQKAAYMVANDPALKGLNQDPATKIRTAMEIVAYEAGPNSR